MLGIGCTFVLAKEDWNEQHRCALHEGQRAQCLRRRGSCGLFLSRPAGMSDIRVVVVGASTGLGRCLGIGLGQRGARVAMMARREDLLVDAATEAGPGTLAIRCDVTDESSCRQAIDEAADKLGGIDAVVVSAGIGELRRIEELDVATWQRVFATNVIGASSITTAALPHLKVSNGMAAYLSSVSASLTSPWPGLASYTVTKAALDKLVEAWRAEHPEVGFTRLIVGECAGGQGEGISSADGVVGHGTCRGALSCMDGTRAAHGQTDGRRPLRQFG